MCKITDRRASRPLSAAWLAGLHPQPLSAALLASLSLDGLARRPSSPASLGGLSLVPGTLVSLGSRLLTSSRPPRLCSQRRRRPGFSPAFPTLLPSATSARLLPSLPGRLPSSPARPGRLRAQRPRLGSLFPAASSSRLPALFPAASSSRLPALLEPPNRPGCLRAPLFRPGHERRGEISSPAVSNGLPKTSDASIVTSRGPSHSPIAVTRGVHGPTLASIQRPSVHASINVAMGKASADLSCMASSPRTPFSELPTPSPVARLPVPAPCFRSRPPRSLPAPSRPPPELPCSLGQRSASVPAATSSRLLPGLPDYAPIRDAVPAPSRPRQLASLGG